MRIILTLIGMWGLVLGTGCQSNLVQAGTPIEMTSSPVALLPTEGDAQMTPSQPASADPGLQALIEAAKVDLAQRLNILATQIDFVEAKSVVWPDSSLGCPQPGMRYKQVQEDGALIILQVQGVVYEYHIGGTRGLFLCEKNDKDPYTPPKLDINNLTPP